MSIFDDARKLLKNIGNTQVKSPLARGLVNYASGVNQRLKQKPKSDFFLPTSSVAKRTYPKVQSFGTKLATKGSEFGQSPSQIKSIRDVPSSILKQSVSYPLQFIGGTIEDIGTAGRTITSPSYFTKAPLINKQGFFDPQNPSKASIALSVLGLGPDVTDASRIGLKSLGKLDDGARVARFTLEKRTLDELVDAEHMIRFPEKYLNQIPTKSRTKKDALKEVQKYGTEIIERISARNLPDKYLTLKSPLSKANKLYELNRKNKLANVPGMGFVGDTKTTKTGVGSGSPNVPKTKPPKRVSGINLDQLNLSNKEKVQFNKTLEKIKPQLEQIRGRKITFDEIVESSQKSEVLNKIATREEILQNDAAIAALRRKVSEGAKKNVIDEEFIKDLQVLSSNAKKWASQGHALQVQVGSQGAVKEKVVRDLLNLGASTDEILEKSRGIDFNNQKEVTKFYRQFVKPKMGEILDEYRYNNMLSNPKTHIRNAFSNLYQTAVNRPATLVFEGKLKEVGDYYKGAAKSLPEAFDEAWKAVKGETPFGKADTAQISTNKLPKFLTVPTRLLEAGDKFFSKLIESGELATGKTPKQAKETAEYFLFRSELNPKGQGVVLNKIDDFTKWTYKAPKAVRWFVPFIRTPMNFAKQWLEYSPLGVTTAIGSAKPREQIAKSFVGSMAMAFGAKMAFEDRTTWAAPTDSKAKEAFYASGKKPYSIKVGDKWVPMMYFGPHAFAVALPAAFKHYQEDSRTALTDSQMDKATKVVADSLKFFSNQTFLSGMGSFIEAASGNIDYSLTKALGFSAGQVIPLQGLVRYINTIVDPVYRKSTGAIETIQRDIPGLSKQLDPYTNPVGEESRRDPANYIAPYDIGSSDKQFEPGLESRSLELQFNAVRNKGDKLFDELKSLDKQGNEQAARKLIQDNKEFLGKYAALKELDKDLNGLQADRKKVLESNLTPEQKRNIIEKIDNISLKIRKKVKESLYDK